MKSEFRKKYLEIRKKIRNKVEKDKIIYQKVIENKIIQECELILIYVSMKDEVDTINLINYFLNDKKKKVAVPRVYGSEMNFYLINSLDECTISNYGILEPRTNKIVNNFSKAVSITPGICFSKNLYRIGYGGGYYDRFYSKHRIFSIGLCYQECLLDDIPHDVNDKKCDLVITD